MSRQQDILNYINNNINVEITTATLANEVGCSLPTIHKFIRENESRMSKISRGTYKILPAQTAVTITTTEYIPPAAAVEQPAPQLSPLASFLSRANDDNDYF